MTDKLFYKDLYLRRFEAEITKVEKSKDNFALLLDRTAFYPVGGGQPCDKGTINGHKVLRVYEKDGEIWHEISEEISTGKVCGEIDWKYRFDLMQQHLGQHILSAVFVRDFNANTVNLRMDDKGVYIDLDKFISEENIFIAVKSANDVIFSNIPVETLYPTMEEIEKYSKRNLPKTDDDIRIVKIGELDYTPCCGTHNKYTGEVGIIKVVKTEKGKNGSRVYFTCGSSGLLYISELHSKINHIQKITECSYEEITDRVAKLKEECRLCKERIYTLQKEKIQSVAEQLSDTATVVGDVAVVSYVFASCTQEEIKLLFEQLTTGNIVAFIGGKTENGVFLMYGCNKKMKNINIREIFSKSLKSVDGRGGGSPFLSQGFGKYTDGFEQIIYSAANEFTHQLTKEDVYV